MQEEEWRRRVTLQVGGVTEFIFLREYVETIYLLRVVRDRSSDRCTKDVLESRSPLWLDVSSRVRVEQLLYFDITE